MGTLVVLENVQWVLSLMRLCSSKCVSSSLVVVIVVAVCFIWTGASEHAMFKFCNPKHRFTLCSENFQEVAS